MDWLSQNWFWVLFALLFGVMHLGHGSHGGHRNKRARDESAGTAPREADEARRPAGHQH